MLSTTVINGTDFEPAHEQKKLKSKVLTIKSENYFEFEKCRIYIPIDRCNFQNFKHFCLHVTIITKNELRIFSNVNA